jgi:hypothetical protein
MSNAAAAPTATIFVSLSASINRVTSARDVEATVHLTEADAVDWLADIMEDSEGGTDGYECTIEVPLASNGALRRIDLEDAAAATVRERAEDREGAEIETRMARYRAAGV